MSLQLEVKPFVRTSVLSDVDKLVEIIDDTDAEEIITVFEKTPERGLLESYLHSEVCWTICTKNDEVCGMFGMTPMGTTTGAPWMIKGMNFPEVTTQFIRQCRGWVRRMQQRKRHLSNVVLSSNTKAIRWLRFCGFTMAEEMSGYGTYNVKATRFYKVK